MHLCKFTLLFALAAALAGCRQGPSAENQPASTGVHFVREAAWLADGKYFYPQEMTELDQTGLASVAADDHPATTTDGENYDPTALAAAHQTLQLPAIVTVTNLQNGRQIGVRVNDRGPANPARVIELTPRAAGLLGISADAPAQVRVVLQPVQTQQLADQLHGGSLRLAMNTVAISDVSSQNLPPPPGVRQSTHGKVIADQAVSDPAQAAAQPVPDRMPEIVTSVAPHPGQLFIRADDFARYEYALREAAILAPYGKVEGRVQGGYERFYVTSGPYPSVADADAALKLALRLGLHGATIIVE